jgi:hypothetical protein
MWNKGIGPPKKFKFLFQTNQQGSIHKILLCKPAPISGVYITIYVFK